MKVVREPCEKYSLSYKKKSISADPYILKKSKGISVCQGCHAVYLKKRWYFDEKLFKSFSKISETLKTVCPACLKIRDNFPGGILTLKGDFIINRKQDLIDLIKNEEKRACFINPLERVMYIKEDGYGNIVIATTNEKLAQKLGREIKKAFHGKVNYHWSHDNKLLRVDWMREAG